MQKQHEDNSGERKTVTKASFSNLKEYNAWIVHFRNGAANIYYCEVKDYIHF